MKFTGQHYIIIVLPLLILFGCNSEQKSIDEDLSIFGKSFVYDYGGFMPKVFYSEADETITWQVRDKSETDPLLYKALGPGRYFVSWKEKDGTVVTQHIDLIKMKVTSSLLSRRGKLHLIEGTINKE